MTYVIVGDTEKYKECLIYICTTKDHAEKVLERMKNNPTRTDRMMLEKYDNIRVEAVSEDDAWW